VSDTVYMKRCLELAHKGLGLVAPNPMVGCVIVKEDKIIGEGFHQKYGEAHAEVNAVNSLPADFDFSKCTLYVNLEPCSHYGKTPPCSDLIISKKFKKVVIGNKDSNPLVAGKGIQKLRNAGIEVEEGVLQEECRELNKRFFTFYEKKRPYVILKWAQTADGFISKASFESKEDNWITGEESKKLVHRWRTEEQGIMVGTNTVLKDNPFLTVRLVQGKNPVRIVVDKDLKLDIAHNVFNKDSETIVFTEKDKALADHLTYITVHFGSPLISQMLECLYQKNISSLIVEGGAQLLRGFIGENLWDEARVFINPDKKFGEGLKAPALKLGEAEKVGNDFLYRLKNTSF